MLEHRKGFYTGRFTQHIIIVHYKIKNQQWKLYREITIYTRMLLLCSQTTERTSFT